MSLPNNTLSNLKDFREWLYTYPAEFNARVDFEIGGVAIGDTSQGMENTIWKASYEGSNVKLGKFGETSQIMFTVPNLVRLALAFDQNMNPCYAWENGADGYVNLMFFDSQISAYTTVTFYGITSPCLTLDDHRSSFSGSSDIIFAYLKDGQICYRQQRDRYEIERVLTAEPQNLEILERVGMDSSYRLQFKCL